MTESVFAVQRLEELTAETDQFGHLDYAKTIAQVLREAKPPFTLGLYGPWGVGKTLVIKAACEEVAGKFAYAIYDAWRYDGDTLRRHLFRDVATTLDEKGELKSGYKLDEKLKRLDVEVIEPKDTGPRFDRKYFFYLLASLSLLALIVGVPLWQFANLHRLYDWMIGIGAAILALLISSVAAPFSRVIKVTQVSEITHRVVDPELFTAMFEDLLKNVKKKRLVIAIDNLDRCSPQRVTDLLETLNTYLEPVGDSESGTDAIFVVAADDGALRRHIESREAKRSVGLDDISRIDVGRYADEYLRKIFTTTIPIKPALSTELKAYVRTQVDLLAREREVEDENLTRLIEVIAEGLRRNPRRVSQFVKNLELRLRLLKQRSDGEPKMMAADLSTPENVPFVAKLLVLEEEYPEAYAALSRDRTLLQKWHEEQAAYIWGSELAAHTDADNDQRKGFRFTRLKEWSEEETRQFFAFLGITRGVQSSQLSAFLSLKQSSYEVELPRWADFRDALLESDGEALQAITADLEPTQLERYADSILDIAREESAYPETVRAIIETAVNDEALWEHAEAELTGLIRWALNDPARKAGLREMPPERMLPLAERLDDRDFNGIVELYATSDDTEEPVVLPVPALAALPEKAPQRFYPKNVGLLRQTLASEAMAARPLEILDLLRWWPNAASADLAVASVQRFATDTQPQSVEAEILTICLETVWRNQGGDQRDELLNAIRSRITLFYSPTAPTPVEDRVAAVESLASLARAFREAGGTPGSNRADLIANLTTAFEQAGPVINDAADVAPILDLVGEIGQFGDEGTFLTTIQNLVTQFNSQNQAALVSYARDRGSSIPQPLKAELTTVLVELVAANNLEALEGLFAIYGSEGNEVIGPALRQAASSGRFEFLESAVGWDSEQMAPHLGNLASTAIGSGTAPGLKFALGYAEALDDEDQARLAEALGNHLISNASLDEAPTLLEAIEASPIAARVPSIIGQLWEAAKAQSPAPVGFLRLIAPRRSQLAKANREAFTDTVEQWLREGAGKSLVDAFDGAKLTAAESKRFVEAVIAYQASPAVPAANVAEREASFALAEEIAGNHQAAKKAVESAIADLKAGSPEEMQLYERLRPEGD